MFFSSLHCFAPPNSIESPPERHSVGAGFHSSKDGFEKAGADLTIRALLVTGEG